MEELTFNVPLTPLAPESPDTADDAQVFVPEGVCAKAIRFAVEDGKVSQLDFTGGCEGNLTAVAKLVVGMTVDEVVDKLSGITCGKKSTSCTDQLCLALQNANL